MLVIGETKLFQLQGNRGEGVLGSSFDLMRGALSRTRVGQLNFRSLRTVVPGLVGPSQGKERPAAR